MVLARNWPIFNVFSLGNVGQEIAFYVILNRKKKTFVRYKNQKLKKSKK